MRVDINLATQPYEDVRRFWLRWGGGLAALGILTLALVYFTGMGWVMARRDRQDIAGYQQQIALCDKKKAQAEATLNQPQNRSTRDRSQFLNDLFQRKSFSWTRVFEDMERVMPPRLHVVSIQPEMSKEGQLVLKLMVAGDSRDRALELVRKMEASQRFQQTEIVQEGSLNEQSGDTVQFEITAVYVPEAEGTDRSAPAVNPRGAM
jgi:type IV pilus assembly protein PilN